MSAFENQAGNWSVVGGIMMDPTRDIHDPLLVEEVTAPVVEAQTKKRKSRRKKNQSVAVAGPALAILPPVITTTLSYAYYQGPIADFESLQAMEPTAKGDLTQLTIDTGHPTDQFGMVLNGVLVAPSAGTYPFLCG